MAEGPGPPPLGGVAVGVGVGGGFEIGPLVPPPPPHAASIATAPATASVRRKLCNSVPHRKGATSGAALGPRCVQVVPWPARFDFLQIVGRVVLHVLVDEEVGSRRRGDWMEGPGRLREVERVVAIIRPRIDGGEV